MSCKREQQLPLLAGEDLSWLRAALLRRHIKRCKSCRSELHALRQSRALARKSLSEAAVSGSQPELWQRIQAQLPKAKSRAARPTVLTGPRMRLAARPVLFAAGLAMIALVVAIGLWRSAPQPPGVTDSALPENASNHPVIARLDRPGVTVMTYMTDDPKIQIVWLFED